LSARRRSHTVNLLRGAFASVADQAVFSGVNFALNVFLARWLTSEGYGSFSVAWSVCLILVAVHNALIIEPMMVVGPSEFATRLGSYLRRLTRLNFAAVFVMGLLAAGASVFYRDLTARDALSALGLALPGYLLLITYRREQYVVNRPIRAFYLSIGYAVLLAGALIALKSTGKLVAWNAVLVTGVSLLVAIWALWRRDLPPDYQPSSHTLTEISMAHWGYGKWLFASAMLGLGISDLQVLLLSKMVDLESAGALRALMNFVAPIGQLFTVLSLFILPKLARSMKERGVALGLRRSSLSAFCIIAMAVAYNSALVVLGGPLEHFLYGGRMAAYVGDLPWLALAAMFSAIAIAFTTPLRAAQNSRHVLVAGIAATLVGLGSSLILFPHYGLQGAFLSLVLANGASAVVVVGTYVSMLRKNPVDWASQGRALVVFDENLISTSPVGSCLLKVVQTNVGRYPLHVYYNRLELKNGELAGQTHIPLPAGPVILRSVVFTFFAAAAYWYQLGRRPTFRIAAQGVFPFSQISYAHFCHRIFLRDHRANIGGSPLRLAARYMIHIWGALTEKMAFRRAVTIVVPSEGLAYELQMAYPDLVAGKIKIIPNPVDTAHFRRPADYAAEALRIDLGCTTKDFLLCFCALGNFERKGLRHAIAALAELGNSRAHLVVVGGQPGEIREYEKICHNAQLGMRVRFVGMQQDIRPYLWSSDAFLFPSSYEAFPLVSLQAAAAGLPLIASRVYGIDEFMIDGKTGWLVERNAKAIAFAIDQAIHNRAQMAAMGEAARERAEEYSETAFCERWRVLLQKLWADEQTE
jgi:glycosyltransferase involved in cell wall biosynthesis/O-antigen/teichoic acid export membrane protein